MTFCLFFETKAQREYPPNIVGAEKVTYKTVNNTKLNLWIFTQKMHGFGNKCSLVAYQDEPHGFFNYGRKSNALFIDTVHKMDEFLVSLGYIKAPPETDIITNQ